MSVGLPEWRPSEVATYWSNAGAILQPTFVRMLAQQLPLLAVMLKLLGSIAIGRLLGFGVLGIIVIYLLLTMLSR